MLIARFFKDKTKQAARNERDFLTVNQSIISPVEEFVYTVASLNEFWNLLFKFTVDKGNGPRSTQLWTPAVFIPSDEQIAKANDGQTL